MEGTRLFLCSQFAVLAPSMTANVARLAVLAGRFAASWARFTDLAGIGDQSPAGGFRIP